MSYKIIFFVLIFSQNIVYFKQRLQKTEDLESNDLPTNYGDDTDENETVPGKGGLRFSNQSGALNCTSPPPPPSAHPRHVVLEPCIISRATESYRFEPKHKNCSIQKTCRCVIWIAVFLGISFGVVLSIVNNLNAKDWKKDLLQVHLEVRAT